MNRTTRKFAAKVIVTLITLVGLVSLGLGLQTSVKGSTGIASADLSQGVFPSGDHFILTNASLKGTYAGVIDCTLVAGPVTGPCAVSYVYTADGNGNITNTDATVNINGQTFFNINFPGTYTVSANGRVTSNVTPINGPLTGVLLSYSNVVTAISEGQITELRGVGTAPPGSVGTTIEKRIRR